MTTINFVEKPDRTLYHNYSLWIFGTEVTSDTTEDSISWQLAEKDGSNTCSFSLDNFQDRFIFTDENQNGTWKPYESAKQNIVHLKSIQPYDLSDPTTGAKVYPIEPGRLIFHKLDTVRLFVHNPYTVEDEWFPAFCGFIESYEVRLDYVTGKSTIVVQCNDLRTAVLQKMRIAVNTRGKFADQSVPDISESAQQVAGALAGNQGELDNIGLFSDLLLSNNQLNDVSAGKPFELIIEEMILGTIRGESNDGKRHGVGFLSKGPSSVTGLGTNNHWPTFKEGQRLDVWCHKCFFGFRNPADGFLTYNQIVRIGQKSKPLDAYSPYGSEVTLNILLPAAGTGAASLVEYSPSMQTEFQLDWTNRFDKILEACNNLDYQFWINGFGDVIVEFPMYDFANSSDIFGEFSKIQYFDKDMIEDSISEETEEMPNLIIATGGYAYEPENAAGDVNLGTLPKAIVMNPILMRRHGVVSLNINIPYAAKTRAEGNEKTVQTRLKEYAALAMQKAWVKASVMNATFLYRPFLMPNRPLEFAYRKKMGLSYTISNSIQLNKVCTTSADLRYIRHKNIKGKYITVGGSENMPISYFKLFGNRVEETGLQTQTSG